ncbi:hypothetical protein CBR_g23742 [Chara braunii]|uniref:tRNA-uridine aminocarboxypropyltransferase 1 n=1 Tax=Chara braunii TaxID=69332 RepID=A0A388JVJ9_CHABU|nr:hypothetical protein CBR_g23742 [Chara braunii]|eukprot:GBG61783.1 hypothetical protein CBR_g23742 [Chara braunii]
MICTLSNAVSLYKEEEEEEEEVGEEEDEEEEDELEEEEKKEEEEETRVTSRHVSPADTCHQWSRSPRSPSIMVEDDEFPYDVRNRPGSEDGNDDGFKDELSGKGGGSIAATGEEENVFEFFCGGKSAGSDPFSDWQKFATWREDSDRRDEEEDNGGLVRHLEDDDGDDQRSRQKHEDDDQRSRQKHEDEDEDQRSRQKHEDDDRRSRQKYEDVSAGGECPPPGASQERRKVRGGGIGIGIGKPLCWRNPTWTLRRLHEGLRFSRDPRDLEKLPRRIHCPSCGNSRHFFCYTCLELVIDQALVPRLQLPFDIDILFHVEERKSMSTAVHVAVLAPNNVRIVQSDNIPYYDTSSTVVLFPSSESVAHQQLPDEAIKKVVIIDAKWKKAGTVAADPRLAGLKKVHVESAKTSFWRYHTRGVCSEGLSTVEAVFFLCKQRHVSFLGESDCHCYDDLLFFFAHLHRLIGNPGGGALVNAGLMEAVRYYFCERKSQVYAAWTFGLGMVGNPGILHGGATAFALDETFGVLYGSLRVGPGFTANLDVNYKRIFMDALVRDGPDGVVYAQSTALYVIASKPS